MDLAPHIKRLTEFAESHLGRSEKQDNFIRMKLDHTLHVLDNAKQIVFRENIEDDAADISLLAALYHDIGRFPQIVQYGTFNDRESTNHGRLGVLTLRKLDMPGDPPAAIQRAVRFVVAQHNLKTTRTTLPERLDIPTKVVRDADKVDIFRVMSNHFSGENPDPTVTHGFEDIPDKYTWEIFEDVMNDRPGDYSLIQYANDFKLLLIGWLKDLHFPASLLLLKERGLINDIFSFLPKDNNIQSLKIKIDNSIHYNNHSPS